MGVIDRHSSRALPAPDEQDQVGECCRKGQKLAASRVRPLKFKKCLGRQAASAATEYGLNGARLIKTVPAIRDITASTIRNGLGSNKSSPSVPPPARIPRPAPGVSQSRALCGPTRMVVASVLISSAIKEANSNQQNALDASL